MRKILLLPLLLLCGHALAQETRKPEPEIDPVAAKAEDDRKALEDRHRAGAAAGGTRQPAERERRGAAAGAGPDDDVVRPVPPPSHGTHVAGRRAPPTVSR